MKTWMKIGVLWLALMAGMSAAADETPKEKCDPYLTTQGGYGYLLEQDAQAAVWWAEGIYKVMRDTKIPTSKAKDIHLSSAGNESESFLVVVRPSKPLQGVEIGLDGLREKGFEYTIRRVEYVYVDFPTDYYSYVGWWPDPLPPVEGTDDLKADSNQAYWITVKTPSGMKAGKYAANVKLSAKNGWKVNIPLQLQVRKFSLPVTSSLRSGFGFDLNLVAKYENLKTDAQKQEAFENYMKAFRDHRISPYNPMLFHPIKEEITGVKWEGGQFDSQEKKEGKYSFKVIDESFSENIEAKYTPDLIPVKGGKPYKLVFFSRSKGDKPATVLTECYDKDCKLLLWRNHYIEVGPSDEWKEYTLDLGTLDSKAAYIKLHLCGSKRTRSGEYKGCAWYDDVRLINKETGQNEFADGNFEPRLEEIGISLDFNDFSQAAKKYFGEYGFTGYSLPLKGLGGGTFYSRRVGQFAGFPQGSAEFEKLMSQYMTQMEAGLRAAGVLDKTYVYWFDEPSGKEDYDFVGSTHRMMKNLAPGIHTFLTEHMPEFDVSDVTDISCTIWSKLNHDKIAKINSRSGNECWSYLCTGPKSPWLTEFIDHDAINLRLWCWISYMYHLKGILIWQANNWYSFDSLPIDVLQNPWEQPQSFTHGYGSVLGSQNQWGNGDGVFFYPTNRHPGEDTQTAYIGTPIPSMRLEILRDGVDDYDYMTLLASAIQKAGKSKKGLVAKAKQLLSLPQSVYKNDTEFSKDPQNLLQRRELIADMIEKLQ